MEDRRARTSLAHAFDTEATKRRYVRRLFDTIAARYDLITRLLSFGGDRRWKRRLVAMTGIRPGTRVLDLACGTGDLAFLAAERGGTVIGIDVAPRMLRLARAKPGGERISWIVGDMCALPVNPASCDLVTTGYGLRNVPDLRVAIGESYRVLAKGGTFCSLDFDRPEWVPLRRMYLAYLTLVGSTLGFILHGDPDTYRYIPQSIQRYPGARHVATMLSDAGFHEVRHIPVLGGLMAIHVAKK